MRRKICLLPIALLALLILVPAPQAQAAHWSVGVAVGPAYPAYAYPAYPYYDQGYGFAPYYQPVGPQYYVAPRYYYSPGYVYPPAYYYRGGNYYRGYGRDGRGYGYRGYDRGRGYYRGRR